MDIGTTHGLFDEYELTLIRIKSKKMIGKTGFLPDDLEDIRQELILHLLQRLPSYDPSKSSRHTFINDVIDNKIIDLVREKISQKRDFQSAPWSLDAAVCASNISGAVTEKSLPWNRDRKMMSEFELFEMREDIIRVLEKLPPNLQEICIRLLQDNICTVAEETGIPKATLIDHLKKIRNHFEISGLKIYF